MSPKREEETIQQPALLYGLLIVMSLFSASAGCGDSGPQEFTFGDVPPGQEGNISVRVTAAGDGTGTVSASEPAVVY